MRNVCYSHSNKSIINTIILAYSRDLLSSSSFLKTMLAISMISKRTTISCSSLFGDKTSSGPALLVVKGRRELKRFTKIVLIKQISC